MSVVGFDFGTTNSLISLIQGERAINFLDDQGLPVPSVVCYEGAQTIVGRAAKERLGEAGLGVKGNVVRSPKVLLGRDSAFIEGVERNPVDIVRDVVAYVSAEAQGSRSRDLRRIAGAVVTIPVNMEGRRRAALRDAFRLAGIRIVQFVHEPLAALYGFFRSQSDLAAALRRYDRKLMLVFDWGGGTLDLTLCRLTDGMLVQNRNDGTDEVGGDTFDEAIRNEVVKRVLEQRGLDDATRINPDALTRLLHRCERAKIDLSERTSVAIYVPGFFQGVADEDLDYRLTRDELEEIVSPLLNKGLNRIAKLLDTADVSPAQIAGCLATGGMANMPAIRSRLHEWFGAQRVEISERSGTLIAEGAAWIAHDKAALQLAKQVELLLARNSYLSLIRAGAMMPSEGEVCQDQFHLYCADPRDGKAKFQLCSPVVPGGRVLANDRRNPLENLVVEVDDKARPFHERLELDVQIDDNLILHAQARSLNKRGLDQKEVHDLEFGLALPTADHAWKTGRDAIDAAGKSAHHEPGDLVLRSNVADRKDPTLIPGELMYQHHREYFDVRRQPPKVQDLERLYYQPCALCGRASNDPLCDCSSLL
ncbi:Hsp70 family protein [Thiorhodococcus mannitoliphagus]|uniref:Hsp70 family protein n=1 Tax=Thiorhodococcus mannitoliphagus TaxID=329406 RepID=A0A6P1DT53_9GAMM|nr:Hsp70 family protein [Thiorhodococcus mannitoliphagus]NEX19866.1 Hsp70 family protein [Thiorhodococcus mannitoliphagus]